MKRIIGILLTILLLQMDPGGAAAAQPPLPEPGWTYYKEIASAGPHGYTSVYLDQEVYARARSDLGDLRVVNASGEYVPYYLMQGTSVTEEIAREYRSSPVQSFVKDNNSFHDFLLASVPGRDIQVNRVALSVSSPSYFFNIQVWGSYDDTNWTFIDNHKIYKVDVADKSYIEFGQTLKYTYYRIALLGNAQGIGITSLKGQYSQKVERYQQFARTAAMEFSTSPEQRSTKIIIKNPSRLHLQALNLKTSGSFYRRYRLLGVLTDTPQEIGSGAINATRINENIAENTSINLPPGRSPLAEYQLIIDDQDDKPISLSAIEGVFFVDKLVFAVSSSDVCTLVYGNPQADKPIYDIDKYKGAIEQGGINAAALGAESPIVVKTPENKFANYEKLVFNTIIVLTSLLLVFLITRRTKLER